MHQPRQRAEGNAAASARRRLQGVIITDIRDLITAGEKLLAQRRERDVFTLQRLLASGVNKDVKFAALVVMVNDRPLWLNFQLIIGPERQNTNHPGLTQRQQAANRFRWNGRVIIDKYPGEPCFKAFAVAFVKMRRNHLNHFMQSQNGIPPRHGMLLLFVAFHFLQIGLRPGKGIVSFSVDKPGVAERIRGELA